MRTWSFNPEELIIQALMEEVLTTPKPGLVDGQDNGAHKDMSPELFRISAETIAPFLAAMMREGFESVCSRKELFLRTREIGCAAERKMFLATKGVNTHKGAIFTIGILCAASGRVYKEMNRIEVPDVLRCAKEMTEEVLDKELKMLLSQMPVSHGEKILHELGGRGIRGEAMDGFPGIARAYSAFRAFEKEGNSMASVRVNTLLAVMSDLYDTNVISRGGIEALFWVQENAKKILKQGGAFSETGLQMLQQMNGECIQRNISSGGAADMLAAVLFLNKMEHIKVYELEEFVTPELADGMGKYFTMDYQIKPRVTTKKIVGRAVTVRVPKGVSGFVPDAILQAGMHDILVIAGQGECNKSYWGGYRSFLAKHREIKGVIIDGAFRDVVDCQENGVPIYARSITPGSAAKDAVGEINVPVICGGVNVQPGDYIAADQNGVIVMDPSQIDIIMEAARAKREKEAYTVKQMKKTGKLFSKLLKGEK